MYQTLKARVEAFAETKRGKRWLKAVRAVFVLGIVGWLTYQLSGIGWSEVWAARPRTPWFYVLWGALYFQLPILEALIYRVVWGLPIREGLIPLFRKRALNQDVVSYSGEAYFFAWARRRLDLPDRMIAGTLKDNAIASSLGAWAAAVLMIGAFLFTGQILLTDLLGNANPLYVAAAVGGTAVLIGIGVYFRRTLLTLPPRTVGGLFAVHLVRFLVLNYVLRILQWAVVLPDTPLSVWATMLAVMTFINRLPLIPAKGLVGIGAILGMTELLTASGATIAAMLLMHSALKRVFNFLLFVILGAVPEHRRPQEPTAPGGSNGGASSPDEVDAVPRDEPTRKERHGPL